MTNEMLLTLIVAGTGVVLGMLGLILAVAAKLSASQALRDQEAAQQAAARAQSAQWMKDQELAGAMKIRVAMLEGVQRVKESLTSMLHAKKGNLNKDAAYKAVSDTGRVFSKLADDHAAKLDGDEKAAMLRARDVAIEAASRTRSLLEEVADPADLSSSQRADVMRLRAELGEAQSVLRDRMQGRLIKRVVGDEG